MTEGQILLAMLVAAFHVGHEKEAAMAAAFVLVFWQLGRLLAGAFGG